MFRGAVFSGHGVVGREGCSFYGGCVNLVIAVERSIMSEFQLLLFSWMQLQHKTRLGLSK